MNSTRLFLYRLLGLFFFGLGTVGIILPLLPTVPLWILAAILFTSTSPALKQKIYDHPKFGEMVEQFVEDGVLTRRSKYCAIAGGITGSAISLLLLRPPAPVVGLVVLFMAIVVLWLALRPESVRPP